VIDTFFVCSNEEDKNIWHFSIVMLQWWEKEATHTKKHNKKSVQTDLDFTIVFTVICSKRQIIYLISSMINIQIPPGRWLLGFFQTIFQIYVEP